MTAPVIIKRIPKEPETYVVWLVPESVGDIASEGVRGAVRATAEDLPGAGACMSLDDVGLELMRAGIGSYETSALGVRRLAKQRDDAALGVTAAQREKDRARIAELEGQRDKAEASLEAVRVELCKAGGAVCPYAEGVARLVKERDKARAALAVYR